MHAKLYCKICRKLTVHDCTLLAVTDGIAIEKRICQRCGEEHEIRMPVTKITA